MMKKLFLTAGAILLAGSIVACGPSTTEPTGPTGPKDVTFKVWGPEGESPIIDWAVAEYNAREDREYNVTTTFEAIGENAADTELLKNVAEGATLYFYADDKTVNLMNAGAISYLDGENLDYAEEVLGMNAVDAATMNNKVVGYTVQSDNCWFANYDKQYLTEEDTKSLETILEKAESVGKKVYLHAKEGWYVIPSFYSNIELYWTLDTNGKGHFTTDLDNPETAKTCEYLNNLFTTYIKKGVLVAGQALGGESESIYTWNGAWAYEDYVKAIGEENLGLTTTPFYTVDGTNVQCKSFIGSKILSVNGAHSADKIEAAHEIAKILVSKEGALRRYEAEGRGSIPTNLEALEDARFTENLKPTTIAISNQVNNIGGYPQAATVQGSEIWGIMGNALGASLVGESDACDETTGLVTDWAAFLATQAERIRGLEF